MALLYVTATWCFTRGPEIRWLNARIAAGDHRVNPVVVVVEDEKYDDVDRLPSPSMKRNRPRPETP